MPGPDEPSLAATSPHKTRQDFREENDQRDVTGLDSMRRDETGLDAIGPDWTSLAQTSRHKTRRDCIFTTSQTEGNMESTPIFQCSVEARELADYLIAQAAKNDCSTILTYEELSTASGCNIREKNGILQTARNIALREARVWYGCVRSLGVRKLDHHEVSAEGEDGRQSILRMSQRKLRRMAVTDFEKLTDEQKVKHNVNASLLGAVHLMNRRSSLKRLEGAVIQSSARIPVSGVLRLFGAQDGEANE